MATASENRRRLEALPIFLRPRFRLFLSVDLVGSTASKQRPNFPIKEPGKLWADGGVAPPWLSPIANFFGSFREAFIREWKIFRGSALSELRIDVADDPTFWKANGDELIFVKVLDDRREILGCVLAWLEALKAVRPILEKDGLDAKATAWTAGFPVTNSELVFELNPGAQNSPYEDDPRLLQFSLLERWYQDSTSQISLLMDFIGPSIDIGFRLAAHSSVRRFVISVDIAYFLANLLLPPTSRAKIPRVLYGGKEVLKGVLDGKPYPIFWIDTKSPTPMEAATPEDKLLGNTQLGDVSDFCLEFYDKHSAEMFVPFIYREDENLYGNFPDNYIEALEHLCRTWEKEKKRYSGEVNDAASPGGAEGLTVEEAAQKEEDIIAAITKISSEK
jgi:hypothetical protein